MTTDPEAISPPVDGLPRLQAGTSPQHLLVTLLADYWFSTAGSFPSAALVALVEDFGVTPGGARSALSRLTSRGLIEPRREGRRTYYRLTAAARTSLTRGGRKVARFGAAPLPWDGLWTTVAFSVPEDAAPVRPQLRARLRILGFAPLYDGVWLSPRASVDDTWSMLAELGIATATVFRAHHEDPGSRGWHPMQAWDLTAVRRDYDAFVRRFGDVFELFRRGRLTSQAALNTRTEIMDTWRAFPSADPQLPDALLPADWPRERARRLFADVYDSLGPLAELRVRQVVGEHAPDLAGEVRHRTTAEMAHEAPATDT